MTSQALSQQLAAAFHLRRWCFRVQTSRKADEKHHLSLTPGHRVTHPLHQLIVQRASKSPPALGEAELDSGGPNPQDIRAVQLRAMAAVLRGKKTCGNSAEQLQQIAGGCDWLTRKGLRVTRALWDQGHKHIHSHPTYTQTQAPLYFPSLNVFDMYIYTCMHTPIFFFFYARINGQWM